MTLADKENVEEGEANPDGESEGEALTVRVVVELLLLKGLTLDVGDTEGERVPVPEALARLDTELEPQFELEAVPLESPLAVRSPVAVTDGVGETDEERQLVLLAETVILVRPLPLDVTVAESVAETDGLAVSLRVRTEEGDALLVVHGVEEREGTELSEDDGVNVLHALCVKRLVPLALSELERDGVSVDEDVVVDEGVNTLVKDAHWVADVVGETEELVEPDADAKPEGEALCDAHAVALLDAVDESVPLRVARGVVDVHGLPLDVTEVEATLEAVCRALALDDSLLVLHAVSVGVPLSQDVAEGVPLLLVNVLSVGVAL